MAAMYTVKKGDTLSEIAEAYYKTYGYSSWQTYMDYLVKLNNISNKHLITIGQQLKLSGNLPKNQNTNTGYRPTITQFGIISNSADERTVYARWTFSQSNVERYDVIIEYTLGSTGWFRNSGGNTDVTDKEFTYSAPAEATAVRIKVRPISKTRKVNGKETPYWTGLWSTIKEYDFSDNRPYTPNVPTVSIEGTTLTAKLENIATNINAGSIEFQILRLPDNYIYKRVCNITNRSVSCEQVISTGYEYKVRCRAVSATATTVARRYSDWTDYSSVLGTVPAAPAGGISKCVATSKTSVRVEWKAAYTATTYELEFATAKTDFEGSDKTTKVSGIETTQYEKTGLETGNEYFFRVRSVNDKGSSEWSEIASVTIGANPTAPTTYSSTTTVVVGETLNLYWIHNPQDNSVQSFADIEITVNGETITDTVEGNPNAEIGEINSYPINTSAYAEGAQIRWRVRTAGVTKVYGDWSIERVVDIYAQPSLALKVTNQNGDLIEYLRSFPFYISALAGPNTQRPIGYHVSIGANTSYTTVDNTGVEKIVNVGDEIYSRHVDTSDELVLELLPSSVDLQNNEYYTVACVVSMDSGLTASATQELFVSLEDISYEPNAEIVIDEDSLSASIRPFCEYAQTVCYKVTYDSENDIYTTTEEVVDQIDGTLMKDVFTEDWDQVYSAKDDSGNTIYFCKVETGESILTEDVSLSVYRREYDGTFTEIKTDIPNNGTTWTVDPHPSLDYARYRIVSISKTSGAVGYCDLPGYPVSCSSVIIQWDETWSNFDTTNEDALTDPEWTGSLLRLPYNIDVSDKHKADVSLIEYIGRRHPVSYYGTQLGETSTWNVEIPKNDKDTLYALRRLAIWSGDVYVREPSGSGYWANISVSFSQKHREVTIPVTLEISRVEGGV